MSAAEAAPSPPTEIVPHLVLQPTMHLPENSTVAFPDFASGIVFHGPYRSGFPDARCCPATNLRPKRQSCLFLRRKFLIVEALPLASKRLAINLRPFPASAHARGGRQARRTARRRPAATARH